MPRGRVRTLDDAKRREVCALMSAGCSLKVAAQYVNCAPNTIRREVEHNADFGQRFRDARLQAQLSPLSAMRKAAADHWRAAAWMLERTDPEHFGRRPAPAFRPKQAKTLKSDILDILKAEIENPFLLNRLTNQIQQLMEYSIDGVVSVERNNRQLREVLGVIDAIERLAETTGQAASDDMKFHERNGQPRNKPPTSPASVTPNAATSSPAKSPPSRPNAKPNPSGHNGASSATSTSKTGPTNPPQPSPPQEPSAPAELDPETANTPVTWGDMTTVLQRLNKGAANGNGNGASAADSATADPPQPHTAQSHPADVPAATAESPPQPQPPPDT
jgi:hypothetical protein